MNDTEYQIESDGLLARLPIEFRNAVANMAWEQGHSAGREEVLNVLRGLVSDLEEPCERFEKRLREQRPI
jgi:hypothetical protein